MGAAFNDMPLINNQNEISAAYCGKTVRDQYRHFIAAVLAKAGKYFGFCGSIHGSGRFIQYQNVRVFAHIRSGEGNFLPLATRELLAIFKPAAKLGFVAVGHAGNKLIRHTVTSGVLPPFLVVKGMSIADTKVFAHLQLIAHEVLKNHPGAFT